MDILVRVVLGRVALHHDLPAGHFQVDADMVEIAMTAPVRRLDHDAAAEDPIVELLELASPLADPLLHAGGGVDVAERDLKPGWHGRSLSGIASLPQARRRDLRQVKSPSARQRQS
jgi:hypothetical protein